MHEDDKRKRDPRVESNHTAAASNNGRNIRTRSRSTVSYTELDAEELLKLVSCITDAGAALILGKTSDAGAYSITVLDGNERIREYAHTPEEFAGTLNWLVSMFSAD